MKVGKLASCIKELSTGGSFCIVEMMEQFFCAGARLLTELECPLAEFSGRFELISSEKIRGAVSVIHECTNSCTTANTSNHITIEREKVPYMGKVVSHDFINNLYSINLYSIN